MRLLFVCTGNICRSPTAEAVMAQLLAGSPLAGRVAVESAGLADWHLGKPPDSRSVAAARRRGYELSDLRARAFAADDAERFDLLLAMDRGHERGLLERAPQAAGRIGLFLKLAGLEAEGPDVPDPYYGDAAGFARTLDLIEAGCRSLLGRLISGALPLPARTPFP